MKNLAISPKLWIYLGVCVAAMGYLCWVFYQKELIPYREESQNLVRQIDLKQLKLMQIMAQEQRKDALRQEITTAEAEFKELKEMFPDRDFIPKRLEDLNIASRRTAVEPVSFKPADIVQQEFYQENHYKIKVRAGFHGLGRFFQEVANFKYPTAVEKVTISQEAGVNAAKDQVAIENLTSTISAEFQLTTYTSRK